MSVLLVTNNYSFSTAKVRLFLKIASFFDFLAFWRRIRAVYPARLCDRDGAFTIATNKTVLFFHHLIRITLPVLHDDAQRVSAGGQLAHVDVLEVAALCAYQSAL